MLTSPLLERLESGSRLGFDTLMDISQRLSVSADAGMRAAAGWAAMYAAQKSTVCGDEAFDRARSLWEGVLEDPRTIYDHRDETVVQLNTGLWLAMAPQLRDERTHWTAPQRAAVYRSLGTIAEQCLIANENDREDKRRAWGILSEVVTLQLMWRPSSLRAMNVVPASPVKDSRTYERFNTDLYAYLPETPRMEKGVNIQVKTNVRKEDREKYHPSVLLIGAQPDFQHPNPNAPGIRRATKLAHTFAREARGIEIPDDMTSVVLGSMKTIHRKISGRAKRKHEAFRQRQNSRLQTHIAPGS